jgi:hypothetical protein
VNFGWLVDFLDIGAHEEASGDEVGKPNDGYLEAAVADGPERSFVYNPTVPVGSVELIIGAKRNP